MGGIAETVSGGAKPARPSSWTTVEVSVAGRRQDGPATRRACGRNAPYAVAAEPAILSGGKGVNSLGFATIGRKLD